MTNSGHIASWLKYLDVEYLDQETCDALSELDINNPSDQDKIIQLAMRKEIAALNQISRQSMMKVLDDVQTNPEVEVRKVISRVGMPFERTLKDYRAFFKRVQSHFGSV